MSVGVKHSINGLGLKERGRAASSKERMHDSSSDAPSVKEAMEAPWVWSQEAALALWP